MPTWRFCWPHVTVNHQYIHTRRGTRLSDRAAAFRDAVIVTVRQSEERVGEGPLVATVRFAPEQATDVDNPIKLLSDSVCAGLGIDDSAICELHVYRAARQRPGWIEYQLEPVGEVMT